FHPYALGMASGVGAGIMMASATAILTEIYPAMADKISALASTSETLSGITGIYVAIFISHNRQSSLFLSTQACNFGFQKRIQFVAERNSYKDGNVD
ncbi:DUF3100 domain-containing protein, partial [Hungatella sp. SL.1.14]|uniref:DUF3100 domain-containing protein n=1 Tax=Hungatella sp. SL.1.14 TaxID=2963703 RepID=UPI00210BFDC3